MEVVSFGETHIVFVKLSVTFRKIICSRNLKLSVTFWSEEIMGYIILTAIIIGLGLILYGQFKYNKGIF